MPLNVAKIYSTLGNSSSLIPLAIKDLSSSTGMTVGSYVTGKEEGFDRFIDEFGTESIWLLGIPTFKALFDLIVFKPLNFDSKFDARNFKDKNILKKIEEYAPDEKVKKNIQKIISKEKTYKGLSVAKFVVSTALSIIAYLVLTKVKQNYTDKKIRENLIKEYEENKAKASQSDSKKDEKTVNSPSFKGLGNVMEYFAFNPVRNMWIVDGSITYERLRNSRNTQELVGYAIKEGSILFFLYFLGGRIQSLMEKQAEKHHNKSIDLDARVLEDETLQKSFEDGSLKQSLEAFKNIEPSKKEGSKLSKDVVKMYEFLHKNPDNIIVKASKQSDIISTYKKPLKETVLSEILCKIGLKYNDTGKIDTRKYIDLQDIEGVYKKLSKLYEEYQNALSKGESSEAFFKGVKKLKRGSIRMNIGASIIALGIFTPMLMLFKRLMKKNDAEFETKKQIREELIKEGIIC